LKDDDVVVSFDRKPVENTAQFLGMLRGQAAGDRIKTGYYRHGKLRTATITLQEKPREVSASYEVIYSSVRAGDNHLRTIITRPKGAGPFPAVLLIGGIGCYSVDNIPKGMLPMRNWVDSLSANGIVTMRVEKSGMGDSKGMPCSEIDFHSEKQGYLEGLRQLKSLPYVHKGNVFIAGFSMGGVIAPLIAKEEPVKGMIVYGTVGRNWLEYELENTHRQRLLDGIPADSLDLVMRAEYKRLYGLYVAKKTVAEVKQEHPETAGLLFDYPMNLKYFQQVADINIRQLWMNADAWVLAMHGTSDFVSSAAAHELIAQIVNRYHPGKATYAEILHSDHWELQTESEKQSTMMTQKTFNPAALNAALEWMKRVLKA
jgi:pimeloyl-ACP methyl ester carboxylesterase